MKKVLKAIAKAFKGFFVSFIDDIKENLKIIQDNIIIKYFR